jgi:hypothetical protein
MADTEMYSSSTGGAAAIMCETYGAAARQRSRWRGQSCGLNSEILTCKWTDGRTLCICPGEQ